MALSGTALVTGARGFIGRNLAQHLADLNVTVIGIGHGSLPQTNIDNTAFSDWVNGDVDAANLQQISANHGVVDYIFHLAGGSHVGSSFQNPAEDFSRTVVAGAQLLEWARINLSLIHI